MSIDKQQTKGRNLNKYYLSHFADWGGNTAIRSISK